MEQEPLLWEQLQPVSLEEQVLAGLRGRILRGELEHGSKLSIRQIAEAYGVSATPVRVAIKQLQVEGLARTAPQSHILVLGLTTDDLMDVNRIRSVLEGLAVRLSTEKAHSGSPHERAAWLAEARHAFELLKKADETDDVAGFVEHHNNFHLILDAHMDNDRLLKEILKVYDYIAFFREIVFRMPEKRAASMKEHAAILAAVEEGDSDSSERITRQHIQNLEKHLTELMEATTDHER